MRRRTPRPVPDVFETFAHRVDDSAEAPLQAPDAGTVARSAGIGLALSIVLVKLGDLKFAYLPADDVGTD